MKKYCFILIVSMTALASAAQKRTPAGTMPDVNKLMNMSPSELEAYKKQMLDQASKKAKELAAQNNFTIDEMVLPDFELKLPVKDLKRLALIPSQPPTLAQLTKALLQSKQQLESVTPKAMLDEVKVITSSNTPAQEQSAAIAAFYSDNPVQALLISMHAALRNPSQMTGWNNLAALYNMSGLEHKAVPVLMNQLQLDPTNSMLLNNMGQAYLGLGDIAKAENYLTQCLVQDPLNPEANRSMGMIKTFQKQYDAAKKYFEKELEVSHRRSTLALLKRQGIKINLYQIRLKRTGIPHHDFFEEIGFSKFKLPYLPKSSDEAETWRDKHAAYLQSLLSEYMFWAAAGKETEEEERKQEGKRAPYLYADIEDELTSELGEEFIPILGLLTDQESNELKNMITDYYAALDASKCPPVPNIPGHGADLVAAYQKKCCDMHKPIVDAYVSKRNAFIQARWNIVNVRWKNYINGMIANVQLNPTSGNKRMVYHTIAEYFNFILNTINISATFEPVPGECHYTTMSSAQSDSIIAASHTIDFTCPAWLNLQLNVQVAKIKASCSSYAIEGGEFFRVGYEHSFTTGTSTIAAGVGVKAKFFKGVGGADLEQMVYVSFDNNNEFSDFGLKGKASVKIGDDPVDIAGGIAKVGGVVAGVEGGYTLGINSGFHSSVKGKGIIADFIKIDKPL